jgi:hypothetical protein
MSGQLVAPVPGGGRIVPPLPAGISILPGQPPRAARRLPVRLIILLVLAGLGALEWFNVWYSDYDSKRIDPVVTRAVLAHAPKGTRLPVTLFSGQRILELKFAFPSNQRGQAPNTCVTVDVLDPTTGAKDPKYPAGDSMCIEGVAITIR